MYSQSQSEAESEPLPISVADKAECRSVLHQCDHRGDDLRAPYQKVAKQGGDAFKSRWKGEVGRLGD